MPEQHVLLFQALTSLHAGSGRAGLALQSPLRRRADNHLPQISASTLQGALRKTLRDRLYAPEQPDWKAQANQDPTILQFFGQKTEADSAGLRLSPAELLALPLRSARGIWALVTSPARLRELAMHLSQPLPEVPVLADHQACCPAESPLLFAPDRLVLEDIELARSGDWPEGWRWLAEVLGSESLPRLVLISDACLELLAQTRTEIFSFASERRTPQQVEFMLPESLFYAVVQASPAAPSDTLVRFVQQCPPLVHLGAYQSLGKGLCALSVLSPQGGNA